MSRIRRNPSGFRWPHDFRESVRILALLGLLAAGIRYFFFARYVQTGVGAAIARPEAAEAFLPLGGVAALKDWLSTGHFDAIHPAAVVIVVATLLTALVFRRALCSWLCPLGALSEYLARLGKRLFGANIVVPKWLDTTLVTLKYVATFLFMFWLLLTPVGDIESFMKTPFYAIADMELFSIYARIGVAGVLVILFIIIASVFVKSFWCRYLCPYGALQGIFSVLSPIALAKNDERCTGCGRCSAVCPNAVDVCAARGTVTSPECIGCTTCVSACPRQGTLRLRLANRWTLQPASFGILFVGAFALIVLLGVGTGHWVSELTAHDYREIMATAADVRLPF